LRGALADARLVAQPWDFSVAEVKSEVELLHGADDQVVPPAHAHWYAAHLPCAKLAMTPGELHLSMCFRSAARIQESCRELSAPPAPAGKAAAMPAEAC
jgi:pimeloyl-ACP methyl ester carboxylesterase